MDLRYDDDEGIYNKKTIKILERTPEDQWKEYRDTWGQTLLHYAARSGAEDKFASEYGDVYNSKWEDLLRKFKGHDAIRARDKEGRSALSWAAGTENLVAIRMLLRPPSTTRNIPKARMPNIGRTLYHKGREVYKNDLDNEGQMPLFHLLLHRNRGPRNRLESPQDGHLSIPGRRGSLAPIKDLIWNLDTWRGRRDSPFSTDAPEYHLRSSWQPDYFDKDYLNGKGRDGRSLLSHAVGQGDFDFVRTLLEVEGIDVQLADNDGTTPLMHAIQRRDKNISILLSSYPLQDLPHTLIGPKFDSVIENLKWAFQIGLIKDQTSGEAVLQHALNLKHLTAAKATLKLGVSPRKVFKYRSDWFELIKHSATQPTYLIVTETVIQEKLTQVKMEYSLDFPDDDDDDDGKTNPNRLLYIYRSFKHFDITEHSSKQYANHSVIFKTNEQELVSHIDLTFPDPKKFFDTEKQSWLGRGQIQNKQSESNKGIRWTRNGKGQAFYHSILQSGKIPEDGNRFISDLMADLQVEWDRIIDTAEDRINKSFTPNIERRRLLEYLATEGKYLATLRQSLYQHTKSTSDLVKDYNDKIRNLNDVSKRFFGEEQHHRDVENECQNFEKGTNIRLQQQEQTLRDARQMEIAQISIAETMFLKRLSLITFIYLPLMFTASIFGMNVNALQSNPDWRWFVLFGLGSLALTYGLWKISEGDFEIYTSLCDKFGRLRSQRSAKNDDIS
ncbi:uncharacterized protein N7503_005561 [Penicillium pulvis]|uniref:uncharacterized protein n=1 Tax=Penicillium pulvis TaxID=1562058 RepID=UPI00254759A3|nr:uncharacterized protein N7503_005561 [Penicillium pulvis]KAJ5803111.1 hypothetical protein N7503_005561 [Penicillium pulvis]